MTEGRNFLTTQSMLLVIQALIPRHRVVIEAQIRHIRPYFFLLKITSKYEVPSQTTHCISTANTEMPILLTQTIPALLIVKYSYTTACGIAELSNLNVCHPRCALSMTQSYSMCISITYAIYIQSKAQHTYIHSTIINAK
jgi:hypothetical protein